MEPIQIYDYVKKKKFHVFVPHEVAERCRIDKIYAEDLHNQIREQNIEEGSTLEIETEVIELPKSVSNTSWEPSPSQTEPSLETWTQEESLKLLKAIPTIHKKIRNTSNPAFWPSISQELAKNKVYKTVDQCKSRWKYLKESYKVSHKTRNGSKFLLYDEVEEVLKNIEDSQMSDEQSDSSDVNEMDEDREHFQSLVHDEREFWTKHEIRRFLNIHYEHKDYRDYCKTSKQFWVNISKKLANEGISKTSEKCYNKWKNLLQAYRKVSNKPTSVATEAFPYYLAVKKILDIRNQSYFDKDLVEDKNEKETPKLSDWNDEETMAIIKIYSKYKEDYDKFAIKKHFWTLIAKALEKEGYSTRDADKCRDKWRSLMRTYEKYSSNKGQSDFKFGKVLDDLFNESLQDSDADKRDVLASQIEKVTNGNGNSEQMFLQSDELNLAVKQENGSTENWSYEETFALIDTFEKYKSKFKSDESNNSFWEQIATDLTADGIRRSAEDCKRYWNILFEMYTSHQKLNMGNSRFIFAKSMERIFKVEDEQMEAEDQDLLATTNTNPNACQCKEKMIREKRKRHLERMEVIKKKLQIEEKKVKAFEEYVKHLKSSA